MTDLTICDKCGAKGKWDGARSTGRNNGVSVTWIKYHCKECGDRWMTVHVPPQRFVETFTITEDRRAYTGQLKMVREGVRSLLSRLDEIS